MLLQAKNATIQLRLGYVNFDDVFVPAFDTARIPRVRYNYKNR
jgi:hypothetical protein